MLSTLFKFFGFSKPGLFKDLIFTILSSMRAGGYFCFKRNVFNYSSLPSSVLSSEIIVFNLLAKLNGMLFLVFYGMSSKEDTVLNLLVCLFEVFRVRL